MHVVGYTKLFIKNLKEICFICSNNQLRDFIKSLHEREVQNSKLDMISFFGGDMWLSGKEPTTNVSRSYGFNLWVGKIPWRRKWQPTPVFLPGKSHGQRSLAGYSPWGPKRVGQDLATKQQHFIYLFSVT